MKIVYKLDGLNLQCPYYEKRGERVSVKQYEDEYGCRIAKGFSLADTPKQAVEDTIRQLGHEPVDADNVKEQEQSEEAEPLTEQEVTRIKASIEALQQSLYSGKLNASKSREVMSLLEKELAKLR